MRSPLSRGIFILILLPILLFSGCVNAAKEAAIEDVLQLSNDILEDPLLKELDSLEEALMMNPDAEALPPSPAVDAADEPDKAAAPSAKAPEPTPAAPPETAASAEPAAVPEQPAALPQKQVLFGIINKVSSAGITLRVIQAQTLTPEELKQIKNGEKPIRSLLTDEQLQLRFGKSIEIERLENRIPVPAALSDVTRGQTVRIALDQSGAVKLLRIIRE